MNDKNQDSCQDLCNGKPGAVMPVVDFNRCEAQSDCVRVCPCNVFEIRNITVQDKAALSLRGKIKTWAHGGKKAYTPNAANCRACGLCVTACPEGAIVLKKISQEPAR